MGGCTKVSRYRAPQTSPIQIRTLPNREHPVKEIEMRKLILKDANGRLTQVDPKALRREAQALQSYIQNADPSESERFSYQSKLAPLVERALSGSLRFPHMETPYNLRLMMEGLEPELPKSIQEIYFQFLNRIQGSTDLSSTSVKTHGRYVPGASEEIKDGKRYEWVEFED